MFVGFQKELVPASRFIELSIPTIMVQGIFTYFPQKCGYSKSVIIPKNNIMRSHKLENILKIGNNPNILIIFNTFRFLTFFSKLNII